MRVMEERMLYGIVTDASVSVSIMTAMPMLFVLEIDNSNNRKDT